jgi:hypothetical protein
MTLWIFFRLHLEDKIFLQDQNVMTYDFMPKFIIIIIIIKRFEKKLLGQKFNFGPLVTQTEWT